MTSLYGYEDVATHADMLLDGRRMKAFSEAIARTVRPGDVVVDVGSGTGILALLAAKAGARAVYAIERGPMAKLIERAAEKNGFADVIRVFRGDARAISLPEKPSVLVSEMISSFGLEEDYLGLLGTVRAQCTDDVRIIPQDMEIRLALADLPAVRNELDVIEQGLGVRLDDLAEALRARPGLAWVRSPSLVSTAVATQRFSVGSDVPRVVGGTVTALRDGSADAIVGWFESTLIDGVTLSSSPEEPRTHWANLVFSFHPPLQFAAGTQIEVEVRPRLITDRGTWTWSVRAGSEVRRGDAMRALVGNKDDLLQQLGMRQDDDLDPKTSTQLPVWAAALAGDVDDTAVLVHRLRAAFPDRFVDDTDAENEVYRLVRAAKK